MEMSLARGIDSVRHDQIDQHNRHGPHQHGQLDDPTAVVIAIAATSAGRLRLAALVSDHAPVLMVGSREEALVLLQGTTSDPMPAPAAPVVAPVVVREAWATTGPRSAPVIADDRPVLVVDSDLREARWLDRTVPLSPLEHDVMVHLVRNLGCTLTFERLHREVWGTDHMGGGGDVQSVVKRLRRKLHHLGSSMRIQPVRGVGLRLVDAAETSRD
jgi:DNA-binding response OmpR family regulator